MVNRRNMYVFIGALLVLLCFVISIFVKDEKVVEQPIDDTTDFGYIQFSKNSFNCVPGKSFVTTVSAFNRDDSVGVRSVGTTDGDILDVKETEHQPYCKNCRRIKVSCLKEGTGEIFAVSTTGLKTRATVEVGKDSGSINFTESFYRCVKGDTIHTVISASSDYNDVRIKSFGTNNKDIISIESDKIQSNSMNNEHVTIKCKKAGSAKIYARSSLGATTTVDVIVIE